MEFELKGVDAALDNIKAILGVVTEGNLQEDGLAALQPVADDARSLAPVDQGDLRDSIEAKILPDGTVAVVIGDWKGHFWEFGTIHHRAQPMLAPAMDANEDLVFDVFGGRIGARIEGAL